MKLLCIQRRSLLTGGAAWLLTPSAFAHHGWSSFDETRPIYVAGTVRAVKWQNPHGELVITPSADLKLPADLASRPVPRQSHPIDGAAVYAKAQPPAYKAVSWTLELAPVSRLDAWSLRAPAVGATVAAIGYSHPTRQDATMRVEYLFLDGNSYGLRSLPTPS